MQSGSRLELRKFRWFLGGIVWQATVGHKQDQSQIGSPKFQSFLCGETPFFAHPLPIASHPNDPKTVRLSREPLSWLELRNWVNATGDRGRCIAGEPARLVRLRTELFRIDLELFRESAQLKARATSIACLLVPAHLRCIDPGPLLH